MAQSVQQIAQKWQQRIQQSGGAWSQGIASYNGNPMEAAAAQADKAVANYGAAKGRMVAGLQATPVSYWKSQAQASQQNYVTGATKGLTKYTAAITKLSQNVWPAMRAASQAAGGGAAGAAAAILAAQAAKANGQT